jgi:hypothetical protein
LEVNLSLFFHGFLVCIFSCIFSCAHDLQKILPAPFQDRTAECRPVPLGALRKEKNNKSRKVGKAQRPPEVKLSAPQFLCVSAPAYRRQGFARVKKKYFAREAAKTLSPPEVKPSGLQILCVSASLRE